MHENLVKVVSIVLVYYLINEHKSSVCHFYHTYTYINAYVIVAMCVHALYVAKYFAEQANVQ